MNEMVFWAAVAKLAEGLKVEAEHNISRLCDGAYVNEVRFANQMMRLLESEFGGPDERAPN